MINPNGFVMVILCLLFTYLIHSTVIICLIFSSVRWIARLQAPALQVLSWKMAMLLPLLTTAFVSFAPSLHLGYQYALGDTSLSSTVVRGTLPSNESLSVLTNDSEFTQSVIAGDSSRIAEQNYAVLNQQREDFIASRVTWQTLAQAIIGVWVATVAYTLARLCIQIARVRRLRKYAQPIDSVELTRGLLRLSQRMHIRHRVDLLQTADVVGALTAGIRHPFILVQTQNTPKSASGMRGAEWNALLAHELAHIAHRDARWNLLARLVQCLFPFQPLNRLVCRQMQIAMDFAADESASRALGDQRGLINCLIRMGDQILDRQMLRLKQSGLVAGVATFRSTLGQRVERLLVQNAFSREVALANRFQLLACFIVIAFIIAAFAPQATATRRFNPSKSQTSSIQGNTMRSQLSTLAVLIGLSTTLVADDLRNPPPAPQLAELKSAPDELPPGIRRFNGMLVGRLVSKDVEKGSFIVVVDAIPRVWENSQAENPKSIVGKTVEIERVFGKFLDVLVTTREGETIEFECKHDGEALLFPGELLRKVAPYQAEDYPILPEAFRGFNGSVIAEVKKKDLETMEVIITVKEITGVWKENAAKAPESIVGKNLMLAGFWNRKESYHSLKVGDQIEVGMRHIGRQSDHLTVAEFIRPSDQTRMERKREDNAANDRSDNPVKGFRGMLVGRLVKKDAERGTFTVTVDAVPRVWENNQAPAPKSLIGKDVDAENVPPRLLDALIVTRIGETIQFGAMHDGGAKLRVVEVLRKVAPVEQGDYPELPEDFRGFRGTVQAKIIKKDEQLWALTAEVTSVIDRFENDRSRNAASIVGKQVMLSGFWNKQDAYFNLAIGDRIELGVEHPNRLGDQLNVIEGVRKLGE